MLDSSRLPYHERSMAQEIHFILSRANRPMTKDEILSIVYLADRYHIRKYGRTITRRGCNYLAKDRGRPPVNVEAEKMLDLIEENGGMQ